MTILGALALVLAGCAAPAAEPAARPGTALMGPIDPPPVYALIGHRARLNLTSEQVATLDSIGQSVHQDNSPLIRRLREMRGDFRGRPASDLRPGDPIPPGEEVRTLMEQIRQNNQLAASGVREVLTPEQETQTCSLFSDTDRARQRMAEQRRRDTQESSQRTAARGMRGPETLAAGNIWPWCAPERPDTSTAADTTAAPAPAAAPATEPREP